MSIPTVPGGAAGRAGSHASPLIAATLHLLHEAGADLAGAGSLLAFPGNQRAGMTVGFALGGVLNPHSVAGIAAGPTREYHADGNRVLGRLAQAVAAGTAFLAEHGIATLSGEALEQLRGHLPLKTLATLAGLGWIGRNAMLITQDYGSAVFLDGFLANLGETPHAIPITASACHQCQACVKACPAGAPLGPAWRAGLPLGDFFDPQACRNLARNLARERLGLEGEAVCGICIAACPYTRAWIRRSGEPTPPRTKE
jgi:epoxyqueuosine reductase QueG